GRGTGRRFSSRESRAAWWRAAWGSWGAWDTPRAPRSPTPRGSRSGAASCWAACGWTTHSRGTTRWAGVRTAWECDGPPDRTGAAALGPHPAARRHDRLGRGRGDRGAAAPRERRRPLPRPRRRRGGPDPAEAPVDGEAARRFRHAGGVAPAAAARARRARLRRRFPRYRGGADIHDVCGSRARHTAHGVVGGSPGQAAYSVVIVTVRVR